MSGWVHPLIRASVLSLACAVAVSGCKGDSGPSGPQGPEGQQGPVGKEGPAGAGAASIVATAEPAVVSADSGHAQLRVHIVNYDGKGIEGRQLGVSVAPVGSASPAKDKGGGDYTVDLDGLTLAGPTFVTITSGSLTPAVVALRVAAGQASPTQTKVFVTGSPAAADGLSGVWLRFVPADAAGNLLGVGRGVSFSATSGSHAAVSAAIDERNGSYSVKVTDTTAEDVEIKASIDDKPLDLAAPIRFVEAPKAKVTLAAFATPNTVVAGAEGVQLIAQVLVDGLPATGRAPEIKSATGNVTVGAVTELGNGLYSAPIKDTVAEEAILTVRDAASGSSTDARLFVKAGAPAKVAGLFDPPRVSADMGEATLVATVQDQFGNKVAGGAITGELLTGVGMETCATDATTEELQCAALAALTLQSDGSYTAKLSGAHRATSYSVRLAAGAFEAEAKLEVGAGSASAAASPVSVHRAQLPADGVSPALVTVTPRDRYANVLGQGLTLTATATGSAQVSAFEALGAGLYRAKVTDATEETADLQVTVGALGGSSDVPLTAGPSVAFVAPTHQLVATASESSPAAGTPVDLTFTVSDVDSLPAQGAQVSVWVGKSAAASLTCTTDEAGLCTVSLTPATAGALEILAQESLGGAAQTLTLTVQ